MLRARWEYLTLIDPVETELATLGQEGWELVTAIVTAEGKEKLYFKRPVSSLSEQMTFSQREAVLKGEHA